MKKFKVSNSKINTWRLCRQKFYYKYILKIIPRTKAKPLIRGTVIHSMLEANIMGKDPWKEYRKAKKSYKNMFKEEKVEYDKLMYDVKHLMLNYFEYYKDDPLDYISLGGKSAEYEFEVDLTPSIVLVGKIDSAAIKDDRVWMVEHKSNKKIPTGDLKYSDIQSSIYNWVMPLIGLPEPDGVCWDYIRAANLSIPDVLKSGELTRKDKLDTLWSVYLEKIKAENLKVSDYKEVKEKLIQRLPIYFVRRYLPINKIIINNLLSDIITTAREMKRKAGKDKTKNIHWNCPNCEYYDLCQAELRGFDTSIMIKNNFEVKDENKKPEK